MLGTAQRLSVGFKVASETKVASEGKRDGHIYHTSPFSPSFSSWIHQKQLWRTKQVLSLLKNLFKSINNTK